ncbi:MAG: UvrD-helicase domain-containing protein [Bacteroides thetaiotaomicron]|nr:UvrD-helicase domain-containing protein [Bacteroides thetaiotaomicron]
MGFVQNILEQHKKKVQEKNSVCEELISRIDEALCDAKSLFSDSQAFVEPGAETIWKNHYNTILTDSETPKIQQLKKVSKYKLLVSKQLDLFNIAREIPQQIHQHNERVAGMKIQAAYSLIGDVEGRKLDHQQMTCIVKEVHNHLVIAGAGTGKTTTVVGKIKYLLKTGKYLPQDILVLSFTNASATEMSERVANETGYNIAASTFHKLGLNIISEVNGVKPKITQVNLQKFVKEQLLFNMQSDVYLDLLNSYLLYNRVAAKSEFEFKSQTEYNEYLRLNPPTTVNNETVKSYGEMDIANFLMQNGIRYI